VIQGSLFGDEATTQPTPGSRIPALTLWQPWASLAMIGAKRHETRSWPIPTRLYGHRIALHAGVGKPPASMVTEDLEELCTRSFGADWRRTLTFGAVLGTCTVSGHWRTEAFPGEIAKDDLVSGIWTPGRWAWRLDDLLPLPEPVPASGAQGIWNWTVPRR
jgi:hypothetical protein